MTPLLTDPNTGEPAQSTNVYPSDLKPVLNIGSHRIAFVNEAISWDALASWQANGTAITGGTWSFPGGSPATATGPGPHNIVWSVPGLYEVTFSYGGSTARRWVRVYANRAALPYEIVSASVNASVDSGWQMELTIAPNHTTSPVVDLQEFQAVGLFCEEEWYSDVDSPGTFSWIRQPVGSYTQEPRLVMSGYIEQGTIRVSAEQNQVSFTVNGVSGQLQRTTIHTTHNWNASFSVPTETAGTIFRNFSKVTTPHIMLWILQAYTNVLERHDFVTWFDNSQQNISQLSSREGSAWSALKGWAEAEFAWLFTDQGNGIRLVPNRHLRSSVTFDALYPPRADLSQSDMTQITPVRRLQQQVVWVQVRGVRIRDGKQFLGRYPAPAPPPGPGQWLVKDRLQIHSQAFADLLAQNFYLDANRIWTLTINQALHRAIGVPENIKISLDIPSHQISWTDKRFLVEQLSYAIDVPANQWRTTLVAKELMS